MKLTVLGGAGACPNPGQGCSAYLVEESDTSILLDCGPDTLSVLRQYVDFRTLTAIVISHLHADHTLDLVPYRYGLKYAPGAADGMRVPLWMPPGGQSFLQRLAAALAGEDEGSAGFFDSVFDVREYDPERSLEIGGFRIAFHPTRHYVPCWAMRLETSGTTLAYLADTGPETPWDRFAHDADLAICEGTLLAQPATMLPEHQGHLTARRAGDLARAAQARRLLLTHLWAEIDFDYYRAEAEAGFGSAVDIARPGLTIEL